VLVFLVLCFKLSRFRDCLECNFVIAAFNDVSKATDDDAAKLVWYVPSLFDGSPQQS
jgi:hypothetical protein